MGGNAAMNAGWRTSLQLFWARNFSRTSCSYPHKYYSADASINQLSKKKLFCFWHHALPDESGFYIHCSVMWNQWSRRIFLKWKKMLWVRVKRLGTILSLPLLRRLVFRGDASAKREWHASDWWQRAKEQKKEERRNLARFLLPTQPRSQGSVLPVPTERERDR